MRGINYLAALGAILVFIGIYCLKALPKKSSLTNEQSKPKLKNKLILILAGILSIGAGLFLIVKALNVI